MDKLKKYIPKIECFYQPAQLQIGIVASLHNHCPEEDSEKWHFHIWIDFLIFGIEITIGERFQ